MRCLFLCLCLWRAASQGRKTGWFHDLVFGDFDQVADLGQKSPPCGIGHQCGPTLFPVIETGETPYVDDFVDGADFTEEIADEFTEMAFLYLDALFLDDLKIGRDGAVLQSVRADFVEHLGHRITKGSGIGSSDVRSQMVLVRV